MNSKMLANITTAAAKKSSNVPVTTMATVAMDLFRAFSDYRKACEAEKTRRECIKAERDIAVERIRSEREILSTYLRETFRERRLVLEKMLSSLDRALSENNTEVACKAMEQIEGVIRNSPLREIREITDKMNDPRVNDIPI